MLSGLEFIHKLAIIQGDSLQNGRMTRDKMLKINSTSLPENNRIPTVRCVEAVVCKGQESPAKSRCKHQWFSASEVQVKPVLVCHLNESCSLLLFTKLFSLPKKRRIFLQSRHTKLFVISTRNSNTTQEQFLHLFIKNFKLSWL